MNGVTSVGGSLRRWTCACRGFDALWCVSHCDAFVWHLSAPICSFPSDGSDSRSFILCKGKLGIMFRGPLERANMVAGTKASCLFSMGHSW